MTTDGYLEQGVPLAFAHRGGAAISQNAGIENTVAAFAHAYGLGYRYFETDVRLSADGVPMAFHDETLDRLTGENIPVAALSASELEARLLDGREPIVRLERLFEEFPKARFNIDIKSDDAVVATLQLLNQRNLLPEVCLASFNHRRLGRIRRLAPDVLTSASSVEAARVVFGLPVPRRPKVYQVPVERKGVPVVTRRFIDRVHRRGAHVHVWTIDDPTEMIRMLDLGVDGIMTDRTDLLKEVLQNRGEWEEPR